MKTRLYSAVISVAIAVSACSSPSMIAQGHDELVSKVPDVLLSHLDAARSAWATSAKRVYVDEAEETWLISYFAEPKLISGMCVAKGELAEMSLLARAKGVRVVEREPVAVGYLKEWPVLSCLDIDYLEYFDMDFSVKPAVAAAAIETVALAQRCVADFDSRWCGEIDELPSGSVADAFAGIAVRSPLRIAVEDHGLEIWYRPPSGLGVDLLTCVLVQEGHQMRVREVRGGQL